MLEAEIAFIDRIEDLMSPIEKLIKNVTKMVLDTNENDISVCRNDGTVNFAWLEKDFAVMTYAEAENVLKNHQEFENGFKTENGITKEHEFFLVKHCGNIPVFVINWPKDIKPFYMRECPNDTSMVNCFKQPSKFKKIYFFDSITGCGIRFAGSGSWRNSGRKFARKRSE